MIERQNNVIFAVISNALGILIMLITTKAMTYYMTTAEYGEFRLIFNVASFLSLFLINGIKRGRSTIAVFMASSQFSLVFLFCMFSLIL